MVVGMVFLTGLPRNCVARNDDQTLERRHERMRSDPVLMLHQSWIATRSRARKDEGSHPFQNRRCEQREAIQIRILLFWIATLRSQRRTRTCVSPSTFCAINQTVVANNVKQSRLELPSSGLPRAHAPRNDDFTPNTFKKINFISG
jgi:hypothetical protein